jgi:hypothetical protein
MGTLSTLVTSFSLEIGIGKKFRNDLEFQNKVVSAQNLRFWEESGRFARMFVKP